jgi:hypothetical protein
VVLLLLSSASLLLLPLFLFFLVFLLLFLTVQGCFNDGEDGFVVAVERKHNGGAQVVILLRLFFFPWCRDTTIMLEEQTMASLMKMVVSLPLRFASSLFLLSLVLSPSLFCFGFSSVAAGGSADGGRMEVLDGCGRRPRWRERSSCWEPEKDDFVF